MLLLLLKPRRVVPTAVSALWRVEVDGEAMLTTVPVVLWQASVQAPALLASIRP